MVGCLNPNGGELMKLFREKRDDVIGLVQSRMAPRSEGGGRSAFVADPYRNSFPAEFRAKYSTLGILGTGATSVVHLCRLKKDAAAGLGGGFSSMMAGKKQQGGATRRGSGDKEPEFRAVKVCRKRPAWRQGTDESFTQLRREITALRLLDHPNVLRSYEDFEDPRHYVFVMEYAAGGELFERLSKVGSFSERTAAALVRDVASALAHCHGNGVIHRDMKLENLLLPTPLLRNVKLADFGMALSSRGLTTTLCGTPGFIAPEQRSGRPYDHKVDLWGLGCAVYIMLAGIEPFDASDDERFFERQDAAPSPPPAGGTAAWPRAAPDAYRVAFPDSAWRDRSSRSVDLVSKLLTVDPEVRVDAASVLAHPWVREGGRKNSYIGPATTGLIGSLVKQRRASGLRGGKGGQPPAVQPKAQVDGESPDSSNSSTPNVATREIPSGSDDTHAALARHLAEATSRLGGDGEYSPAPTPDVAGRTLDDAAYAGDDDADDLRLPLPEDDDVKAFRHANGELQSPHFPPGSPMSDVSTLECASPRPNAGNDGLVDEAGREIVEIDLASLDMITGSDDEAEAGAGAEAEAEAEAEAVVGRFDSHDRYGLDADAVFNTRPPQAADTLDQ